MPWPPSGRQTDGASRMPEIVSILVFLNPKSHQVSVWKLNTNRRKSKVTDFFEPTHQNYGLHLSDSAALNKSQDQPKFK